MTSGQWPLGWLRATERGIEVQALWRRLEILPAEIVELRFYSRLFPRFDAVVRTEGGYSMASFSVIRGERLRSFLGQQGFTITHEARWRPWAQASGDTKEFDLYDGD